MAGNTSPEGSSVLGRAARLLGSFDAEHPALTLTQLAARSGLPTTTTHRLLRELTAEGLLARDAYGRYSVGTRLWELGELSTLSLRLRETALPHLLTLYEATRENAHVAVLDGWDALYVARVTGTRAVPTLSRMGGRHPLPTTGVGKALLATRDEDWLREYFRRPLERETTFSVTSEKQLRDEISRARLDGYATTRQEMTLGNGSIAAALPGVPGLPPTAVGIVAHLARADIRRLAPLVMRTASAVAAALEHR